jgi:N-methylhydantoinase B
MSDVRGGFVTAQAARAEYGVVTDGDTLDAAATLVLRANRPEVGRFYRQEYVNVLV